jgi:hypothetical protein
VLWTVTALGYGFSALTKVLSPSWANGAAIPLILGSPVGHPAVSHVVAALPAWMGVALTYGTIALEASYVPLAFVPRARPWLWLATMLLHAGLVVSVDIQDISLGMLAFHAALFDPRWVRRGRAVGRRERGAVEALAPPELQPRHVGAITSDRSGPWRGRGLLDFLSTGGKLPSRDPSGGAR